VASHKEITITLAGCTTKAHVDDAVKAVENLEERPAKEIVKLYEDKGVALNNLCTGCAYCKGCPKEIEIPKFMDAYNQQILTGKETAAKERLNNHWGLDAKKAAECIACGKCERACTQHLPIIEHQNKDKRKKNDDRRENKSECQSVETGVWRAACGTWNFAAAGVPYFRTECRDDFFTDTDSSTVCRDVAWTVLWRTDRNSGTSFQFCTDRDATGAEGLFYVCGVDGIRDCDRMDD